MGAAFGNFFRRKMRRPRFCACDIRHDPTADDRQMVEYLYFNMIPFTVIATKADKLSRAQIGRSVQNIATAFKCGAGDVLATSSETRQGLDLTLQKIESVIDLSE
ncbi:MAG: hypothetical protein K2H30_04525 [Clostridia bacterium]|nr:hypothetical protein [Clostridia bacterium]